MKPLSRRITLTSGLILVIILLVFVVTTAWLRREPATMTEALRRMQQYQTSGRYEDAISVGKAWVTKHPNNGSNDQIFGQVAFLFLEKAKTEDGKREQYVASAVEYRDKMLPVTTNEGLGWYSAAALQDSALISEYAGDMSDMRRCDYYRDGRKLLDDLAYILQQKRAQLSNRIGSKQDQFGYTPEDAQRLLQEVDVAKDRIAVKQRRSNCQ